MENATHRNASPSPTPLDPGLDHGFSLPPRHQRGRNQIRTQAHAAHHERAGPDRRSDVDRETRGVRARHAAAARKQEGLAAVGAGAGNGACGAGVGNAGSEREGGGWVEGDDRVGARGVGEERLGRGVVGDEGRVL